MTTGRGNGQPSIRPSSQRNFSTRDHDVVAVEVRQLVRDLDRQIMADGRVFHVYRFSGDLVERIDVEELGDSS